MLLLFLALLYYCWSCLFVCRVFVCFLLIIPKMVGIQSVMFGVQMKSAKLRMETRPKRCMKATHSIPTPTTVIFEMLSVSNNGGGACRCVESTKKVCARSSLISICRYLTRCQMYFISKYVFTCGRM